MFLRYKKPMIMLLMCLSYGVISLFNAYSMIKRYDKQRKHEKIWNQTIFSDSKPDWIANRDPTNQATRVDNLHVKQLDILDTSGVGLYLWEHILQGKISEADQDHWHEGFMEVKDMQIWYRLGYGLWPEHGLPMLKNNLFLVLNGRSAAAIEHSKAWLDYALSNRLILNLGLLLLGDEYCNNEWLNKYLDDARLRLVFLVYDSAMIDNRKIFSWPLGVAAYRGFGSTQLNVPLTKSRKYTCNFYGTMYQNSSRQRLQEVMKDSAFDSCKFKWRKRWVEDESLESLSAYQDVLANSDLTLSPVGRNAECYRTYEAMELGSIPIVENLSTSAKCNISPRMAWNWTSPYHVLKEHNAPLIYINDWRELPAVLKQFEAMSTARKVKLRLNLIRWYSNFKKRMKVKFLSNTIDLFHWDIER